MSKMGGVNGNMTSALGFANIKLNVFGCELKPAASMSDYYTLCSGGSSTPQQNLPSSRAVEERAQSAATHTVPEETPFSAPPKGEPDTVTDEDWDDAANASQEELDASFEMY